MLHEFKQAVELAECTDHLLFHEHGSRQLLEFHTHSGTLVNTNHSGPSYSNKPRQRNPTPSSSDTSDTHAGKHGRSAHSDTNPDPRYLYTFTGNTPGIRKYPGS
jgi:hypothetical protein